MSRYVHDGGRYWPRVLFDPPVNPPAGECMHCGGTGVRAESIDEERYDVLVPCRWCQTFCKVCDKWVQKAGHECAAPVPEKGAQP